MQFKCCFSLDEQIMRISAMPRNPKPYRTQWCLVSPAQQQQMITWCEHQFDPHTWIMEQDTFDLNHMLVQFRFVEDHQLSMFNMVWHKAWGKEA